MVRHCRRQQSQGKWGRPPCMLLHQESSILILEEDGFAKHMGDIGVFSQWYRRWLNSLWWRSNLGYLRPCLGYAACCLSSGLRSLVSGKLCLMPTANFTSTPKGTLPGIGGTFAFAGFSEVSFSIFLFSWELGGILLEEFWMCQH